MDGRLDPDSGDIEPAVETPGGRLRSHLRSRVVRAWIAAGLWAAVVWMLGGDSLSAASTAGILRPVIEWFRPDFPPREMYALLVTIRKVSHVAEYGLLTLLILRALWIGSVRSVATSLGLTTLLVGTLALADEARQAYSPERTGSGWDVGLDLGGAALFASALLLLQALLGRPLFSRDGDRE
jgi:VanZ family protein